MSGRTSSRLVRCLPLAVLLITFDSAPTSGGRAGRESSPHGRDRVTWPAAEFRDLQAALNAVRDGGVVEIRAGDYELSSPLFVNGKRITIRGAGSGRPGEKAMTHLYGPDPRPVLDASGRGILPADSVVGLLNFAGCDATVRDLRLSGFDAGLVFRDSPERMADREEDRLVRAKVLKVHISHTGRGILSQSSGDVNIANSLIEATLWNGISMAPKLHPGAIKFPVFSVDGVSLLGPGGAGIYFEHTFAAIGGTSVDGAEFGGIVGLGGSALILDSFLTSNAFAGIFLWDCTASVVGNSILLTQLFPTEFGDIADGVLFCLSSGLVQDNVVAFSKRLGMGCFGSAADLAGNHFVCSASYDIAAQEFMGQPQQLSLLDGNACGCGDPGSCMPITDGDLPIPNAPTEVPDP